MMGILFVGDVNGSNGNLVQEMLHALADQIAYFAATTAPHQQMKEKYRIVRLRRRLPSPYVHWRGLPQVFRYGYYEANSALRLQKVLISDEVSLVLITDPNEARKWRRLLEKTNKPIFIYCLETLEIDPTSLPKDAHFIVAKEELGPDLEDRGVDKEQISVCLPGVQLPKTLPARQAGQHIRILSHGGEDLEGYEQLINAFERACELGLDGVLTIVGDSKILGFCGHLVSVKMCKERVELEKNYPGVKEKFLKKADVFCAQRGATQQVIEAMMVGLPIVSAYPDALIVDSENGTLCSDGDEGAYVQALFTLAQNPDRRLEMGKANLGKVKDVYGWGSLTKRFKEITGRIAALT